MVMKKYLSLVLTLAMLLGCVPGGWAPALAEEEILAQVETDDVPVEEAEVEASADAAEVEEAEAFDLIPKSVEADAEAEPEATDAAEATEAVDAVADAPATFVPRYARALRDIALENGATLCAEFVALITGETEEGLFKLALHGPEGLVAGTAEPDALSILEGEALEAYLNALTQAENVFLYEDDLNAPLPELTQPTETDEAAETDETVQPKAGAPEQIIVNHSDVTIAIKEAYTGLVARAADAEGIAVEGVDITWQLVSGDKYIALDAATGTITGLKKGSAIVEALALDGTLRARVNVNVAKAPSKITLTASETELLPGETAQLKVEFSKDTACGDLRCESSNTAVATVDDNGVVTAVQKGKASIRVSTFNGKSSTISLTVFGPVASMAMEQEEYALVEGMTIVPGATALDADGEATLAKPTFTIDPASQDPSCVSLDSESGAVTAQHRGEAILIATAGQASATCKVKVVAAPMDMALSATTMNLGVKETFAGLSTTLIPPEGESDCQAIITWRSSNPKIVLIDAETGKMTGVKAGTATITARTHNGIERSATVTVRKAPKAITLNKTELLLGPGATALLTGMTDEKTASAGYTFTSSDPSVATVDSATGLVTGVARGTASITATSFNGKRAVCRVTVLNKPSSIQMAKKAVSLAEGMTQTLEVDALDADGMPAMGAYTWTSDDPSVISVDAWGAATALAAGSATITVACEGLTDSCTVNVVAAPMDMTLSVSSLSLGVKETRSAIGYTLTPPAGETDCAATVTWRTSNPKVVTVDAETGAITGVKAGSATLTASTQNGIQRSVSVTVRKAPSKITLNKTSLEMSVGMRYQLVPTLTKNTASGHYDTRSSNPDVADVDDQCVITAHASGTATITISTYNGKSATCRVTVYGPPAKVALGAESYKAVQGMNLQIEAEARDDSNNPTPASLTYSIDDSSADSGCITVNASTGAVSAVRKGSAVVRVSANDSVYALCPVSVVAAPTAIRLNASEITIGVNETYSGLALTMTPPAGESDCEAMLQWTSDKPKVVKINADTGVITGAKAGTATVRVKTHNGLQAAVSVRVVKAPSSLTVSPSHADLSAGETYQLAPVTNTGVTSFSYVSSDPNVASVSDSGLITAIGPGSATVTISSYNKRSAFFTVTVTGTLAAPLNLSTGDITLGVGETFSGLSADVEVTWTNSVPGVATLSGGTVTALSEGTTVLTATAASGAKASISVKVLAAPTSVTLSPAVLTISAGSASKLTAQANSGAHAGSFTFASDNTAVATVDSDGTVHAVTMGTATITAEAYNGAKGSCTVTVVGEASQVFVTESLSLAVGATEALKTTIMDENGVEAEANCQLTILEGSEFVKLDGAGNVTAVAEGTAKIGVAAGNGVSTHIDAATGTRIDTVCVITVVSPVTRIVMPDITELRVGETIAIEPVLYAGDSVYVGGNTTLTVSGEAASLNGNVLTALSAGAVTVTASVSNDVTASCTIDVYQARYRFYGAFEDYFNSSENSLVFSENNVKSVKSVLTNANLSGTTFTSLGILANPVNKNELLSGIKTAFADSQSTDVSVVYLCMHGYNFIGPGDKNGATRYGLQLPEYSSSKPNTYVTAAEIYDAISTIQGKVILILDSCYSGQFIYNMRTRLDAEPGKRISVLSASEDTKAGYHDYASDPNYAYDYFTYYLLMGLKYDMETRGSVASSGADANGDGKITINEMCEYIDKAMTANLNNLKGTDKYYKNKEYDQVPYFYEGGNGDLVLFS